jgi:hypothetical protein
MRHHAKFVVTWGYDVSEGNYNPWHFLTTSSSDLPAQLTPGLASSSEGAMLAMVETALHKTQT